MAAAETPSSDPGGGNKERKGGQSLQNPSLQGLRAERVMGGRKVEDRNES